MKEERPSKITLVCGTYQDYELILKSKFGAKEIEIPDPCRITIAPIDDEAT